MADNPRDLGIRWNYSREQALCSSDTEDKGMLQEMLQVVSDTASFNMITISYRSMHKDLCATL